MNCSGNPDSSDHQIYYFESYPLWISLPSVKILEDLIQLDLKLFPYPWTESGWRNLDDVSLRYYLSIILSHPSSRPETKILGFSLFLLHPFEELAHLLKVLVIPEARGKGVGQLLLKNSFDQFLQKDFPFPFKKVYLEVEHENVSALQLYRSLGFKDLKKIKNFYGPKDALTMILDLLSI